MSQVYREQWQAVADLMRAKAVEFDELARLAESRSSLGGPLGKADWIYDDEMDLHLPCCTRRVKRFDRMENCGNGPLVGEAILMGDCGEHADTDH